MAELERLALQGDTTAMGLTTAEKRFEQFRAAGADKAENPGDLARAHIEGNRTKARREQTFNRKQRLGGGGRGRLGLWRSTRSPTMAPTTKS